MFHFPRTRQQDMSFDVNSFLDLQVTGSNDTKLVPVPVGEYLGLTGEVEVKSWQGKDDPTKTGLKLLVPIKIDDPAVKEATGRDTSTVVFEAMLDILPGGGLDMGKGKNVQLGRIREATGLNDPSAPFSFRMLAGRPIKASVIHEEWKGDLYAKIKAVAKP